MSRNNRQLINDISTALADKETYINAYEDIKEGINHKLNTAVNKWNATKQSVTNAWDATKNKWNATKQSVSDTWNATKQGVSDKWNATKQGVNNALDKAKQSVNHSWGCQYAANTCSKYPDSWSCMLARNTCKVGTYSSKLAGKGMKAIGSGLQSVSSLISQQGDSLVNDQTLSQMLSNVDNLRKEALVRKYNEELLGKKKKRVVLGKTKDMNEDAKKTIIAKPINI